MVTVLSTATTTSASIWQPPRLGRFTPAPNAMIILPDQDWIAFGVWMTTPDATTGQHRLGVVFEGMERYNDAGAAAALAVGGLNGSAIYTGGAAGIYVDGPSGTNGFFTANASLTANFDVDGDGTADTGDYTLGGQINDFVNSQGLFLGADTQSSPNDPASDGENDWVVQLNRVAIQAATGDYRRQPAYRRFGGRRGVDPRRVERPALRRWRQGCDRSRAHRRSRELPRR